jgi:hypothetical protein
MRAILALQQYSIPARKREFMERIARAQAWLKQAKPVTTEDFSMRLSGLTWSGAAESDLKNAAKALLALQRSDGGWGANPYLKSDHTQPVGRWFHSPNPRSQRSTIATICAG